MLAASPSIPRSSSIVFADVVLASRSASFPVLAYPKFRSLMGFLMCYGGFTNCDTNTYYISIPDGFSDVSRLYTID